ncbi:MAG TPA: hypothetical protein VJS19_01195 [Candidatus Dormibacteraeota bacterium]|nr:hypothetical protein [Candidatus Dormibacteraeota bacterium]
MNGIISARLLVLQSKRLMLASLERRFADSRAQELRTRLEVLKGEAAVAHHNYKDAMLRYGAPDHAGYWLVAYTRLVEMGNALTQQLTAAVAELPADEQYEASTDIEMLERIVGRWREGVREAMAESVA